MQGYITYNTQACKLVSYFVKMAYHINSLRMCDTSLQNDLDVGKCETVQSSIMLKMARILFSNLETFPKSDPLVFILSITIDHHCIFLQGFWHVLLVVLKIESI